MAEGRIYESIAQVGRRPWHVLFPGQIEDYDYLSAVEQSSLQGFRWRYVTVHDGGRIVAAAPAFLTHYSLDTTLAGESRRWIAALRRLAPSALTLPMACLGSPCTETLATGFAPDLDDAARRDALAALLETFEDLAARERCTLLALKDVPLDEEPQWESSAYPRGYRTISGLPVARLDLDFDDVEGYLKTLSPGTRRDMRRKLRALDRVRIEIRHDIDDVIERVCELYRQTRARGEMQFEDLPADYFTGVVRRMAPRAFYVLYFEDDELLGANLLLKGGDTLVDKFFCMDAERGRALNLYFLSWFTNVRLALGHRLSCYQSGQAAYANKLRLGSRLAWTSMYFRHRNAVLNGVLRIAAPLLDPTADLVAASTA